MAKADARFTTNSAITVTDLNTTVNCEPRVHDLRLAEALGFSDRHMIRALIRRHLPVLRTFGEVFAERKKPSGSGGRPGTDYYLNKRQALFVTAKSDTERAALVTVQMVEVFDTVTRQPAAPPEPALPHPPAWGAPQITDTSTGEAHARTRQEASAGDPGAQLPAVLPGDTKGRAAFRIGNRVVFVDTTRYVLNDEPAVVLTYEGKIRVEPRTSFDFTRNSPWLGERFGYGPWRTIRMGAARPKTRDGVWIIGAVIQDL